MKPVSSYCTFWATFRLVLRCRIIAGLLLGCGLVLTACVTPLDIDAPASPALLVVDGQITDQPGPYQVKLSRSSSLDALEPNPVGQASVVIEEEGGPQVTLREDTTGTYVTDPLGIRGEVGKRYRLHIALADESRYQSDWVSLKKSPPINELSYNFEEQPTDRGIGKGVQILLDTRDPENNTRFYRWEWDATWLHIAPFASDLKFIGNDQTEIIPSKAICFNTSASNNILIGTSASNSEDIISRYPLVFVPAFGGELRLRYSILAKQYAISEDEYFFWKALEEANENSGGFHDRQPQSTVGNIVNLADEDEPVLGYFSAAGYAEKRMFINRTDLPEDEAIGEAYVYKCYTSTDTLFKGLNTEQEVFDLLDIGMKFYDFYRNPAILGWILVLPECYDCTEQGGTMERPDFW